MLNWNWCKTFSGLREEDLLWLFNFSNLPLAKSWRASSPLAGTDLWMVEWRCRHTLSILNPKHYTRHKRYQLNILHIHPSRLNIHISKWTVIQLAGTGEADELMTCSHRQVQAPGCDSQIYLCGWRHNGYQHWLLCIAGSSSASCLRLKSDLELYCSLQ